jgi:hypothetical protein
VPPGRDDVVEHGEAGLVLGALTAECQGLNSTFDTGEIVGTDSEE